MTDKSMPKKRDRVRVTLEGEVATADDFNEEFFVKREGGSGGSWVSLSCVTSIEKLGPKLPTADQSVIRVFPKEHPLFTVILIYHAHKGVWRYNSGAEAMPPKAHEDFEVLYDAGVTSDRNNQEEK